MVLTRFNDFKNLAWSKCGSLLATISEKATCVSSFLEIRSVSTWKIKTHVAFQDELRYATIPPDNSVVALAQLREGRESVIMLVNASTVESDGRHLLVDISEDVSPFRLMVSTWLQTI